MSFDHSLIFGVGQSTGDGVPGIVSFQYYSSLYRSLKKKKPYRLLFFLPFFYTHLCPFLVVVIMSSENKAHEKYVSRNTIADRRKKSLALCCLLFGGTWLLEVSYDQLSHIKRMEPNQKERGKIDHFSRIYFSLERKRWG